LRKHGHVGQFIQRVIHVAEAQVLFSWMGLSPAATESTINACLIHPPS
jgi:hypothetical protein